MQKISKVQLKKTIVAAEAERLKNDLPFRLEGANLQKNRQASEKMVSQWMKDSGLDLEKLYALNERRDAELERLVAQHKADAGRLASRYKNDLHPDIAGQSKALLALVQKGDFFPHPSFSFDKPFLIWTTPLLPLFNSAAQSFRSFAKFGFSTSGSRGTQKVSFYFFWPNPHSEDAVINATTFLFSSGHIKAHAPWAFGTRSSKIEASARFGLWFGVQNDLTATGYVTETVGFCGAKGSELSGSMTTARTIFAGSNLSKTMFVVPAGKLVVFEVALFLEYENDGGRCEVDFQNFEFRIACPVVVFSVVNTPRRKLPGV